MFAENLVDMVCGALFAPHTVPTTKPPAGSGEQA
jgi:hypothetical protein